MDHLEGLIKPLNCEAEDMSSEWQAWKKQLSMWLEIKEVDLPRMKLNYLRLLGGLELQKICDHLQVGENEVGDYDGLISKLDDAFIRTRSFRYERHVFRQITQKETEKFDSFLLRLQKQAMKCGWSWWVSNESIADQIVTGCRSDRLRARILEKDSELEEVVALARSIESVEMQKSIFKSATEPNKTIAEPVSAVVAKAASSNRSGSFVICYQCGKKGHIASSKDCPAKDRSCNSCGQKGHFAARCVAKKEWNANKRRRESDFSS